MLFSNICRSALLTILIIAGTSSMQAQNEAHSAGASDADLQRSTSYSEDSAPNEAVDPVTQTVPLYVLKQELMQSGPMSSSVPRAMFFDRAVGAQSPGLGAVGSLAILVGVVGALTDKNHSGTWWAVAGGGLVLMLVVG